MTAGENGKKGGLDPEYWVAGVERAMLEMVIVTLWRVLAGLGAPVRRLVSFVVWYGVSLQRLAASVLRLAKRMVKWLTTSYNLSWLGDWCPKALKRYHIAIVTMMVVSIVSTVVCKIREQFDDYFRKRKAIEDQMSSATSYAEYSCKLADLRKLEKRNGHRKTPSQESKLYPTDVFKAKARVLKDGFEKVVEEHSPVGEMVRGLREDLVRSMGNMQDSYIYEYFGEVPVPIRDYLEVVKKQIEYIRDTPHYPLGEKLSFLQETRHAFGRTALLCSGGGGLGTFHLGVVKALLDNDMLPRIVGGSSVGSIVSGIVGTHTDEDLRKTFANLDEMDISFFSNSTLRQFLAHFLMKGHLQDEAFLVSRLKNLLGELTFQEAHAKTGRVLNVVVCAADTNEPPRVLNYLTAPEVLIWSAVAASSAFPGLFPAQDIRSRNSKGEEVRFAAHALQGAERRWRDGSLEEDLPLQTLRELFNVNNFLVSQTNPHIVPLINFKNKFDRRIANMIESEWKHRCQTLQWLLPECVPTKWLTLFSQNWEGDVTMVPPNGSSWALRKAIVNPTRKEMMDAAHAGELATWRQLPAIQSSTTIERTLDDCLGHVISELRRKRGEGPKLFKSRIPSWLHMPALGMPNVDSLGSLLGYEEADDTVTGSVSTGEASSSTTEDQSHGGYVSTYESNIMNCLDDSAKFWKLQRSGSVWSDIGKSDHGGLDVIAP